jgi:hypothetical protein
MAYTAEPLNWFVQFKGEKARRALWREKPSEAPGV